MCQQISSGLITPRGNDDDEYLEPGTATTVATAKASTSMILPSRQASTQAIRELDDDIEKSGKEFIDGLEDFAGGRGNVEQMQDSKIGGHR